MRSVWLTLTSLVFLVAQLSAQSVPTATLTSSVPMFAAELGAEVAIGGSTIVSPTIYQPGSPQDVAIFVYTKPANKPWTDMTESARLLPPSGVGFGVYGSAISGDGNTIAGVSTISDFVYVYTKPAGGWHGVVYPVAVLVPGQPVKPWIIQGKIRSIAMNSKGDTIVAGAYDAGTQGHTSEGKGVPGVIEAGAAYVWVKPSGGWAQTNPIVTVATLTASDGVSYDHFGWAVGVSANTIVIGAPANGGNNGSHLGAAYLFQRPAAGIWHDRSKFTSKFTASDPKVLDVFGYSVAIGNSGALVAVGSGRGCNSALGSAYVFDRPSPWWPTEVTQTAEVFPSDSSVNSCFGLNVTVGDQQVLVGAQQTMTSYGAVYAFSRSAAGWTNLSLPAALTGISGSFFGYSEAVSGTATIVGSPGVSLNGNNGAGAIYLFEN